jgi:hypothetical protein
MVAHTSFCDSLSLYWRGHAEEFVLIRFPGAVFERDFSAKLFYKTP